MVQCLLALLVRIGAQYGRQEAWTTVDQALIRGLGPHDQGSSWGFLCLANARRMVPASNPDRGFPDLPSLPSALGAELCLSVVLYLSVLAAVGCVAAGQVNFGSAVRAMAQMKPTNSRAIATTTLGVGLPAATSLR